MNILQYIIKYIFHELYLKRLNFYKNLTHLIKLKKLKNKLN